MCVYNITSGKAESDGIFIILTVLSMQQLGIFTLFIIFLNPRF